MFSLLHGPPHPGIHTSQSLVGYLFVWFGMRWDISQWSWSRHSCQGNKVTRLHSSLVMYIPVPAEPFTHIHVDLVCPLNQSAGFSCLFTVIDRLSRWQKTTPLKMAPTHDCAQALLLHGVVWFGILHHLMPGHGTIYLLSLGCSFFNVGV